MSGIGIVLVFLFALYLAIFGRAEEIIKVEGDEVDEERVSPWAMVIALLISGKSQFFWNKGYGDSISMERRYCISSEMKEKCLSFEANLAWVLKIDASLHNKIRPKITTSDIIQARCALKFAHRSYARFENQFEKQFKKIRKLQITPTDWPHHLNHYHLQALLHHTFG